MNKKRIACFSLLFLFLFAYTQAQDVENELETRTNVEVQFKPFKKVKLSFSPELRFDESFSLDKYLFEAGAEYKVLKFLELGATYRFVVNPRDSKSTEYFNRYSFSATTKKEFGDFETAFRLQYSNYADDDISDKSFLRYKASLAYDIPHCKLTPFVAAELFQQFNGDGFYKMRYTAGVDYKLFKNNYLGVSYKLDYYNKEYTNKHIIGLGYKFKF
ncbi:DUF2490 domain-containing protein [uncultured Draconibacterium sp.]|uniref:DUF2490 domain-containing protein n=1 Tax=uncultured Draconibacterium sp. TaxID=1573823 RepID=UPI0032175EB5